MNWRSRGSVGVPLGLLFMGLVLAAAGGLLDRLITQHIRPQEIGFLSFLMGVVILLSLPVLVILAYHTLSCLTLRYRLDRNGLAIRWAGGKQVIPIRDIQRILPGRHLGGPIVRRQGVRWPGHERGEGAVPGIGRARFLATRPLKDELLLVTPGQAIGISPHDPEGFLAAFEARKALGPNRLLDPEVYHASWFNWPLWTDRTAWVLLGAALIINLCLFGYLCIRYPGLDLQLPLHFNSLGQVDRIGTKTELFALPIIGVIILGTNSLLGLLLYRREQAGAYLLWGAAAGAQALFWLATLSIVS